MKALVPGAGPLYLQVRDLLTGRIGSGQWAPGDLIPSEIRLASALQVSQGTVRKAIDELVARNVLVRQQGKGTFVSTHERRRALFHFFHVVSDGGKKSLPDSRTLSCRRLRAARHEATALKLPSGARVLKIERIRFLDDQPTILETITLPADLFPELGKAKETVLPNTLYAMYENDFGITIHRAEERLRAVAAEQKDTDELDVVLGAPLLEIERIASTLDGTPVELRISRCDTLTHYYENTLI